MRIERIKIKNLDKDFEEKFDKKDTIICVLELKKRSFLQKLKMTLLL